MPINLKSIIENDSATRLGGFSGAVFLTYTLNLGFFEQIVAPALERAGCSNVLIIADPDGYTEALERGQRNVSFAGMRYVCTAIHRRGYGVQHAKVLLMAGANRGRLLIGSGNLTLHGYSQNLEVYSHFEYDREQFDVETKLAFYSTWKLIQEIAKEPAFSPVAQRQLDAISETAGWLSDPPPTSSAFKVWNNYQDPIWSQFDNWRKINRLTGSPIKELRIFSPFYDQDGGMLCKFTENLLPSQVKIYLSQENTTLIGAQLEKNWPTGFPLPLLYDIKEARENQSQRLLHGKVVVGIEENGSWCIAGSANMTRAAFEHSWKQGSNLEMVNFRWSSDQTAFDYLVDDRVSIASIGLNTLNASGISDHSEQPRKVFADSIVLTELTLQNKVLSGSLNQWPVMQSRNAELVFVRSKNSLNVTINQDLRFQIPFTNEIRISEAAFIRSAEIVSFPRWIDIPLALQEYGSRSYHERIQAKLDTVIGAEALFHELLEFLFDRVALDQPRSAGHRLTTPRSNKSSEGDSTLSDDFEVPDVDRFVVPERDVFGRYRIEDYTRHSYDHNIRSLRDLLSIVLLKLTAPPDLSTETKAEEDEEGNHTGTNNTLEKEGEGNQICARQRLSNYLIDYCRRYAHRLCQNEFISNVTPAILLENHLTLSRVLLEFNSRVVEYKPEDFSRCNWLIWAPFFWPSIVSIEGKSCWNLFSDMNLTDELIATWKRINFSSIFIALISSAFGQPPSWSLGFHTPQLVARFLALHELVGRFTKHIGIDLYNLIKPESIGLTQVKWEECLNQFKRIALYVPPAKERLAPILDWIGHQNDKIEAQPSLERIRQANLLDEFKAYETQPKPLNGVITEPDDEGQVYCPHCGGALRLNSVSEINKGKLVLCSSRADVWLYKIDPIPKKAI